MLISVIIPTFNEESRIADLIQHIRACKDDRVEVEIIVSDGNSSDQTFLRASECGAVTILARKGRSHQMNSGAAVAKGEVLFFLHADTIPPLSFLSDVIQAIEQGYSAGCFRLSFNREHWFLRFNCWFTRFNFTPFRFGDQGLFIKKDVFQKIGGYNSDLILLEDQEIVSRIKRCFSFVVLNKPVITCARKYLANGIFKLQFIFTFIFFLYQVGLDQESLVRLYRRLVQDERIAGPQRASFHKVSAG